LLTHPTLDLLHQLGLNGMAKAFGEIEASGEAATLTHPEWLGLLLDQEVSYRRDRRLLRATSCRNTGRHHLGMPGRLHRNPQRCRLAGATISTGVRFHPAKCVCTRMASTSSGRTR
jgi:hypothetical protein